MKGRSWGAAYQLTGNEVATAPNWTLYIAVESADQTAAKVIGISRKLLSEPFDVATYGQMGIVEDPSGRDSAFGRQLRTRPLA